MFPFKKFIKQFCLLLVIHFFAHLSFGQQSDRCAFDRHLEKWQQEESFQKIRESAEQFIQRYENNVNDRNLATINIPVVVHIFHTGQTLGTATATGANPNDAQIISGISDMTAAFRHTGVYTSKNAYSASLDVNFSLAGIAPDGSATSGIIRHDVSGETWGTNFANNGMDGGQTPGVPQVTMTQGRYFPPMDYMNIYIVHEVENAVTTLGFASFPQSNPGATDGMVMLASAFGYDPENDDGFVLNPTTNLNGTANHETGHYLNLYHSFTGDDGNVCPANTICGTNSDCCADIPPHIRTSGCPADNATANTCVSGGGPNTYIHNFMDYADDACFHGFSNDQKTRMDAALNGQRKVLDTSMGSSSPSGNYPTAVTTVPSISGADQTMGIYDVTLNGTTFQSWSSYHDGGYVNRVASAPTVNLQINTAYTLTVQVGVGNGSNNELVNVYIDYNNDGDFEDANETVSVAAGGSGKKNGDAFVINFTTPVTVIANQKLRMRIVSDFDSGSSLSSSTSVSSGGQIEDYSVQVATVLPVELVYFRGSLINTNQVLLEWKTANEINNKGFHIERRFENEEFIAIDFTEGKGNDSEETNYNYLDRELKAGNWYYRLRQVDFDGTVEYSKVISVKIKGKLVMAQVFPNPTTSSFTLKLENQIVDYTTFNLFDSSGKLLEAKQFIELPDTFDFGANLPNGIYYLELKNGKQFFSQKLVKID